MLTATFRVGYFPNFLTNVRARGWCILCRGSAFSTPAMAVITRSKLKELDRVALPGTITRLYPQPDGRIAMTLDIGHTVPVTLDAMWANADPETLTEGDTVRVEGRIERINRSGADAKWDTASVKLDGYAYRVTLLLSAVSKAS